MVIKNHETPNPLSRQFTKNSPFVNYGHHAFYSPEEAYLCPLAQEILAQQGVAHVLVSPLFLTVTAHEATYWENSLNNIQSIVERHCEKPGPLIQKDEATQGSSQEEGKDDMWQKVSDIIENHVTPAIASHGGFISLSKIENDVVYVSLQGACDSCPSAMLTLKDGIENLIKFYIPTIKEVQSI